MRKFTVLLILPLLLFLVACGEAPAKKQIVAKPTPAVKKVVPPFVYTEKPTLEMISDDPIKGIVNGKTFIPKTIVIENEFDFFGIKMLEGAYPDLEMKDEMAGPGIDFELNGMPKTGIKMTKAFEAGGGIVMYRKGTSEITSWSGENIWVVEFTKWEVNPWKDDPNSNFILAGKASGRLAVCLKASSDGEIKNSFASGTFKDIPVIYMGKPGWLE